MEEKLNLGSFVQARVRSGASKQAITEQLVSVGWSEEEAEAAYAEALISSGVPAPESNVAGIHARKASTMDIVLNFFSFILLGVIATALGTLYFQIIEKFFPDPLASVNYYSYSASSSAAHYSIAALLIAFPLYYYVVRLWFRRFREDTAKTESALTKWVTYLVLLIASVTIVGDLIFVLFTFLQGEISARFFLKAITILAISGSVFGFYFLERKKVQYKQEIGRSVFQRFGLIFSGFVIVGIIFGFVAAGSPTTERNRSFDSRRASDLSELSYCIKNYSQEFQQLPSDLDQLLKSTSYSYCANKRDPETGAQYEYEILSPIQTTESGTKQGEYQLCATFALASGDTNISNSGTTVYRVDMYSSDKWSTHEAGRNCDSETVVVKDAQLLRTLY